MIINPDDPYYHDWALDMTPDQSDQQADGHRSTPVWCEECRRYRQIVGSINGVLIYQCQRCKGVATAG